MSHFGPLCHKLLSRTIWSLIEDKKIQSHEGTIQGDPLAMPLYALATTPLIQQLSASSNAKQTWYADDSAEVGKL